MQAPEDQGKPALPWANTSTEPDTDAKAEQVLNADESTATAAEPPPSKRPKTDSKENLEPQPVAKAAPARHFKTGEYIEVRSACCRSGRPCGCDMPGSRLGAGTRPTFRCLWNKCCKLLTLTNKLSGLLAGSETKTVLPRRRCSGSWKRTELAKQK